MLDFIPSSMPNVKLAIIGTMSKADMAGRIKDERKRLKLTQEELGKAASVKKAAVSLWEKGDTKNLKLDNLFKIADRLRVHARWLALGEGPRDAKEAARHYPPEVLKLASRIAQMAPEQRKLLLAIFESAADIEAAKAALSLAPETAQK